MNLRTQAQKISSDKATHRDLLHALYLQHVADYQRYVLQAREWQLTHPKINVDRFAEKLAMADYFVPATYTGWVHCRNCGIMSVPKGPTGKRVHHCIWCDIIRLPTTSSSDNL